MNQWIDLNDQQQLLDLKSGSGYAVIFKHSTRCSVSMMAKRSFERELSSIPQDIPLYFLDLIKHRQISSSVADLFNVFHESPQVLLLKDGACVYNASHEEISAPEVAAHALPIQQPNR